MGTRLYVGNLPFSVDETTLRSLFEQNERTVAEVKLITAHAGLLGKGMVKSCGQGESKIDQCA